MTPRVFVSSTFYDLRYIREDLSNFIRTHGFEPMMFEDGDIGYTPGKALDTSCYDAMRSADMVILIIGGSYGSPASDQSLEFGEYLSVTRKEFRAAVENGIPIFAFIDSSIKHEYGIYESNIREIEEDKRNIHFKATQSINVFRFIREIMTNGNIAVTEFNSAATIKSFLGKQWADMFKNYLQGIKNDRRIDKLQEAVTDIQGFVEKMNFTLNSIGKKVLGEDFNYDCNAEIKEQDTQEYGELCQQISSCINFHTKQDEVENRVEFVNRILDVLIISKGCAEPMEYDIPAGGFPNQNTRDCSNALMENLRIKGFDMNGLNSRILYVLEKIQGILCDERQRSKVVEMLTQDEYYEMFFIDNVIRKIHSNY